MNYRRACRLVCGGLVLFVGAGTSCTKDECFLDSECGEGKICVKSKCVTGQRGGGIEEGDAAEPPPGDPFGASDFGPPGDNVNLDGPEVSITSPSPYELVQDIFTIEARVWDPDGIAPGSVEAIVAERFFVRLDRTDRPDFYAMQFDARQIPYMAFPTLVVTAYDTLGKKGYSGTSFALDREPPIVSLDSPDLIALHYGTTGLIECSRQFNPLGYLRVQHGDVVDASYLYGRGFFPRVRIEDQGNNALSSLPVKISGVDNRTTFFYLLDQDGLAAGHKLLLGDGAGTACNRLDPGMLPDPITPLSTQAIVQKLVPAERNGRPFGEPDLSQRPVDPVVPPCEINGVAEVCIALNRCYEAPPVLCAMGEIFTIWIGRGGSIPNDSNDYVPPAVYVANEFDTENWTTCSGGPIDAINTTADGPACLAAVASDNFGNVGYSAPIAICIDKDGVGGECVGFAASPPDPTLLCTNNCTTAGFGAAAQYFWYSPELRDIYDYE